MCCGNQFYRVDRNKVLIIIYEEDAEPSMHLPLDELALVTLQKILHCDYFWDQQICSKIGAATLMNEVTSVVLGGTPREKPSRATASSNPTHESPRARLELASCQTRNDKPSGPRAQPSSAATLLRPSTWYCALT